MGGQGDEDPWRHPPEKGYATKAPVSVTRDRCTSPAQTAKDKSGADVRTGEAGMRN